MPTKIHMIQINVLDPEKAATFYIETLGFARDNSKSIKGVPVLRSGDELYIVLYLAMEKNRRKYPHDTGPLLVFEVENIYKTIEEWSLKGVKFIASRWADPNTGVAVCPFGSYIAFEDLDGNIHEVLQPFPKKQDD